jgi:hypothetical protein
MDMVKTTELLSCIVISFTVGIICLFFPSRVQEFYVPLVHRATKIGIIGGYMRLVERLARSRQFKPSVIFGALVLLVFCAALTWMLVLHLRGEY